MTVHSIDEVGCPGTFPTVDVRIARTHHLPTEDVSSLSGRAEMAGRQLLLLRKPNNFSGRDAGIRPFVTHPMAQPVLVELPEAHRLATGPTGGGVPTRLMPSVRHRACHQLVLPARSF